MYVDLVQYIIYKQIRNFQARVSISRMLCTGCPRNLLKVIETFLLLYFQKLNLCSCVL